MKKLIYILLILPNIFFGQSFEDLMLNNQQSILQENFEQPVLAFPSAKGAGKNITGGRGGTILKVTNLNDSGTGSFRQAMIQEFPRIIVFDVSGTIELESILDLKEVSGNFTVAGQTAPEGGITISGAPIQMGGGYNHSPQPCNNGIFRYIRFRNAQYTGVSDVYLHNGFISTGTDGLIFDHCSFSFNDDQAISMNANYGILQNITVQNSIFSENATGIVAGLANPEDTGNMSFINNLFADNSHRNPNLGGNLQYDVINNVYFNWASRSININAGIPNVNHIGNYYIQGGFTTAGHVNKIQGVTPSIHTSNNYHSTLYITPQNNDYNLWRDFTTGDFVSTSLFTTQFPILGNYNPTSALLAYSRVTSDIGANKFLNADGTYGVYIDSFDAYEINNVVTETDGDPINKTWVLPTLPENTRAGGYDANNNGIADVWETANMGADGANDIAPSGYTWIEEFINQVDNDDNLLSYNSPEYLINNYKESYCYITNILGQKMYEGIYKDFEPERHKIYAVTFNNELKPKKLIYP